MFINTSFAIVLSMIIICLYNCLCLHKKIYISGSQSEVQGLLRVYEA